MQEPKNDVFCVVTTRLKLLEGEACANANADRARPSYIHRLLELVLLLSKTFKGKVNCARAKCCK